MFCLRAWQWRTAFFAFVVNLTFQPQQSNNCLFLRPITCSFFLFPVRFQLSFDVNASLKFQQCIVAPLVLPSSISLPHGFLYGPQLLPSCRKLKLGRVRYLSSKRSSILPSCLVNSVKLPTSVPAGCAAANNESCREDMLQVNIPV